MKASSAWKYFMIGITVGMLAAYFSDKAWPEGGIGSTMTLLDTMVPVDYDVPDPKYSLTLTIKLDGLTIWQAEEHMATAHKDFGIKNVQIEILGGNGISEGCCE